MLGLIASTGCALHPDEGFKLLRPSRQRTDSGVPREVLRRDPRERCGRGRCECAEGIAPDDTAPQRDSTNLTDIPSCRVRSQCVSA